MEAIERLRVRLPDETNDVLLAELLATVEDRILLRVQADTVPAPLVSVAVDATVKLYNRRCYEGISSEGGELTTSFVNDILEEYNAEFGAYLDAEAKRRRKLRFL